MCAVGRGRTMAPAKPSLESRGFETLGSWPLGSGPSGCRPVVEHERGGDAEDERPEDRAESKQLQPGGRGGERDQRSELRSPAGNLAERLAEHPEHGEP